MTLGGISFLRVLQENQRADERTRTADLISLRVITQALQGIAGGCKCRIFRGVSFLRLAQCCTVLRSRWYQIGINFVFPSALYEQKNQGSKTCASKFSLSMQVDDQQ